MVKTEVRATEYECDGCGKIQLVTDDMEIMGLQGTAYETTTLAGLVGGEWFACTRKCVAKAIIAVIERRDSEPWGGD